MGGETQLSQQAAPDHAGPDGVVADRPSRWLVWTASIALALNVVARFAVTGPLSGQEALDLRIVVDGSLLDQLVARGTPPLFHVVLDAWTTVVGDGARAARALSLVLSLLAVPLAGLVGRRLGPAPLGALCAFVVALSPFCFRYGTEIGPSTLVVCEVLVLFLALPRRAGDGVSVARLAAIVAAAAAVCWTTYWGPALVVVIAAMVTWSGRRHEPARGTRTAVAVALFVGLATFAFWIPSLLDHVRAADGRAIRPTSVVVGALVDLAGGPFPYAYILLLVLVVVWLVGYGGTRLAPHLLRVDLGGTTLGRALGLAASATLVVCGVVGWLVEVASEPANAAVVFPLAALLAAVGIGLIISARGSIAALVLVVLATAACYESFTQDRTQLGEAIEIARALDGDPLVVPCGDEARAALTLEGSGEEYVGEAITSEVLAAAGDRPVVVVTRVAPNRPDPACVRLAGELGTARTRIEVLKPDPSEFVEPASVVEFR